MRFEFATAARILFGRGVIRDLPGVAQDFGRRVLLVTGRNADRAEPVAASLESSGLDCRVYSVHGEPTLEAVRLGAREAREDRDLVIGCGGGSAIDAAKAIAALATNSGEPLDYLEVIGAAQALQKAPLPFLAVPTTAGTGAEVTRNAVLGSPEHGVKASLRSPLLLAKVALIDPDLTLDLPPHVTASTGLDALTQLIEPYVSLRANAMTDLFCIAGLKRVANSLERVFHDGHDLAARESMSFASLLSGLALANAGLGAVHGFASPLGGMLDAPHGALCAAVLPHATAVNIRALRARDYHNRALRRYEEIACILTGEADAMPDDGAEWVAALCKKLAVPNLRRYGLDQGQIPELVTKAARASSMKANPLPLTTKELTEIAERAL
jgi:alcohol dehydrogenase class IV